MKRTRGTFLLGWAANIFGIWLAVNVFETGYVDNPAGITTFVVAGLIFSLVNSLIKPIIVLLSLPFLIVSLGLFMFVINGIIVYLTFGLIPGIDITFWHAILTGVIISLVNYVLSGLLEVQYSKKQKGEH